MELHGSVRDALAVAVETLKACGVPLTSLDGKIPELSHTFFTGWMKLAAKKAPMDWVASDPYAVPRADSEAIMAAANAWKHDPRLRDDPSGGKLLSRHRKAATKLSEHYLLTPLLRLPYWKTAGLDKETPMFTAANTNNAVPFLPTHDGKDPQGNHIQVLDPTFNPFCVLANSWKTPSVTIPFTIEAPHPIRNSTCTMPYALLLTAMPKYHHPEEENTSESLMKLLRVAHKLALHLRDRPPGTSRSFGSCRLSGRTNHRGQRGLSISKPTDMVLLPWLSSAAVMRSY
jgi:hypothetical protein